MLLGTLPRGMQLSAPLGAHFSVRLESIQLSAPNAAARCMWPGTLLGTCSPANRSTHAGRHTARCMPCGALLGSWCTAALCIHRSAHRATHAARCRTHVHPDTGQDEHTSQRALCGVRRDACRTTHCSMRAGSTPPGACHTAQTHNTITMHTTGCIA